MRRVLVLALGAALAVTGYAAAEAQTAQGQAGKKPAASAWKAPRNAMGQPDLSGYWSNATLTPLTRNPKISNKAVLSPAEAKQFEQIWAKALADSDAPTTGEKTAEDIQKELKESKLVEIRPDFLAAGGDVGGYNTFWIDPGINLVQINGEYRSSILTTPNGMPPARKPQPAGAPRGPGFRDVYDSYEYRSQGERCINGFGRNAPPPMLPNGYYNNNYQFLQTPDSVVIHVEMIHEARVVRLNAKHRTDGLRPYMGDSIGWYDGDTLVVETTNLPAEQQFMGAWKNLKVTERFTRVSPDKILYQFQVEDPDTWDKPWGGEYTFNTLKGIVYEYACHEGNYALPGILAGARLQEKEAAASKTSAPAPAAAPSGGRRPGAD
ncbi:hypothetical protein [Phenylobacterium sp.]|jgi:hypothetical protein|uniref:hypothetical protein n=1 Tax=Phenylobacterium sp. TaxID=1871053 RepID=UPI002F93B92C